MKTDCKHSTGGSLICQWCLRVAVRAQLTKNNSEVKKGV